MSSYNWPQDALIEQSEYGVYWYRIADEKIDVVASEGNMKRAAVDSWREFMEKAILSRPLEDNLYLITDLTGEKQGFSPYAGRTSQSLYQFALDNRTSTSYVAVVIHDNIISQIIRFTAQKFMNRQANFVQKIFTDHEQAIAWLQEVMNG